MHRRKDFSKDNAIGNERLESVCGGGDTLSKEITGSICRGSKQKLLQLYEVVEDLWPLLANIRLPSGP